MIQLINFSTFDRKTKIMLRNRIIKHFPLIQETPYIYSNHKIKRLPLFIGGF